MEVNDNSQLRGNGPELWTLENASRAIQVQQGLDESARKQLLRELLDAAATGALKVRNTHTGEAYRPEIVSEYCDLVTSDDVNLWFDDEDHHFRWFLHGIPSEVQEPGSASIVEAPKASANDLDLKPWIQINPNDPIAVQPWYTPARYFARKLVIEDPTLMSKKLILADKVVKLLTSSGFKKRGGVKPLDATTVLKAFANVVLG